MKMARITLATLLVIGQACSNPAKVDIFLPIEGNAWAYGDLKTVEVTVDDTTQMHNVSLNVRHSGDYEWQNLYVKVHIYSPRGDSASELVSIPLVDELGKWRGAGLADTRTLRHEYKSQIQFKQLGKYRFTLEQYMRVNPLSGIKDVGLRVAPASE